MKMFVVSQMKKKKRKRLTDTGSKTVSSMSTMLDPRIFTEERETIMENEPKCEQRCCVGDRLMDDFHFFAYRFYVQVCYNISLMKKKIMKVIFESTHRSLDCHFLLFMIEDARLKELLENGVMLRLACSFLDQQFFVNL